MLLGYIIGQVKYPKKHYRTTHKYKIGQKLYLQAVLVCFKNNYNLVDQAKL